MTPTTYQMSNKLELYTPHTDMVMARLRSPKVKDTDEPKAQEYLAQLIEGACLIRGQKEDAKTLGVMAALLALQLRRNEQMADLTWEEVAKALQDGAFGEYGPVYGINAATIYDMVKGYVESGYKLELSQKVRALREGQQRKNQERVAEFLANNSEYARILMEKARDNSTR